MAKDIEYRIVIKDDGSVALQKIDTAAEKTDKSVEKTGKSMRKTGDESSLLGGHLKKLEGVFGSLSGKMSVLAGAAGFAGVGFGLEHIVSVTGEAAKEADVLSSSTGMSAQSAMYYNAALKARGISTGAVVQGFKYLSKGLGEIQRQEYSYATAREKATATGKTYTGQIGQQAEALQQLGLSLNQLKSLKGEQLFDTVVKKFSALENGANKTRLAALLFGKGASTLMPILQGGSLGLAHMVEQAKKFYPALGVEGPHALEKLMSAQAESKLAWEGLEITLGVKLIPAITSLLGGFSKLIWNIEHGHGIWHTLRVDADEVFKALKEVWNWVTHNKAAVDLLVGALGFLATAWAVEKVLNFYRAIKSLTLIQTITGLVRGLAGAEMTELVPAEVAATDGAISLEAAFVPLIGTLGAVALAAGTAYLALKAVRELERQENPKLPHRDWGQTPRGQPVPPKYHWWHGHQIRRDAPAGTESFEQQFKLSPAQKVANAHFSQQLIDKLRGETHGGRVPAGSLRGTAQELSGLARALGESEKEAKAIVLMDGVKIGEVLANNRKAMKRLTQAVENSAQFRAARASGGS